MKALKLNKVLLFLAVIAVALTVSLIVVGVGGAAAERNSAMAQEKPRIVLYSDIDVLDRPYREFTITVRIEGVSSVPGGIFASSVRITPRNASELDFVRFVPITENGVVQSITTNKSHHLDGVDVVMEGSGNDRGGLTEDFAIGSFVFKFKDTVTVFPESIVFDYEDVASASLLLGQRLNLDSGTFTLNVAVADRDYDRTNTLSSFSVILANTQLPIAFGNNGTTSISAWVSKGNRANVTISATRDGTKSSIKVTDSVAGATLVSERTANLQKQPLGDLAVGQHVLTITVISEAGYSKNYTVTLIIAETSPRIVLTANPTELSKSSPYDEITLTAKVEGITYENTYGGVIGSSVKITPTAASNLDFVRFIPNPNVMQSELMPHKTEIGNYVTFEASSSETVPLTEDFIIGSYVFKLKETVTVIPSSLVFNYEDMGSASLDGGQSLKMESGTLTVNISDGTQTPVDPDPIIPDNPDNPTTPDNPNDPSESQTPISKPVLAVTETGYNGNVQDFTPQGMAELVAAGKITLEKVAADGTKTPATIDDFKQTNAGSYQIVASPNEGYCWQGVSGSSAQASMTYTFEVSKAPLKAVEAAAGELPLFTSESYKGSLEDVITYKYYKDQACTEEVNPSELKAGESYFLKAVLQDGAKSNFSFDQGDVTQVYVSQGFAYSPKADAPKKANTGIVVGIIAGVVAVLVISVIVVFVAKNRKKDGKNGRAR